MTKSSQADQQALRIRSGGLLFVLALACASHAQADLYKWTDAEGKVHYTDQPPTTKAQTLKSPSTGQAEATSQATQALDAKDQAYKKRQKELEEARAKADKEAEQARAKRENCAKARSNLSALQNTSNVYTTNAAGQRVYMDEASRASALASSQKAVSEYCE